MKSIFRLQSNHTNEVACIELRVEHFVEKICFSVWMIPKCALIIVVFTNLRVKGETEGVKFTIKKEEMRKASLLIQAQTRKQCLSYDHCDSVQGFLVNDKWSAI